MSSLGIGSPLRPANRLLAANMDMVLRVLWVALPMWGRITGKERERKIRVVQQPSAGLFSWLGFASKNRDYLMVPCLAFSPLVTKHDTPPELRFRLIE